jgi:hypothetical protein
MRTRLRRWAVGLAVVAAPLLVPTGTATAQTQAATQRLAKAYAPVVMVRKQEDPPCDTAEEQYRSPTSVDTVLGNPAVTLTHYVPGKGLENAGKAPTARDIAGLGDAY